MTFTPGRLDGSPACGAACAEFLVARGEIGHLTSLRYLLARKRVGDRNLPVILESPGGYLLGATLTGRLWRKLGVTAIVAKAVPTCGHSGSRACPAADRADGVIAYRLAGNAKCASACPVVYAGATGRVAGPGARFGVHASSIDEDSALGRAAASLGVTSQSVAKETEEDLASIFLEFGVDPALAQRYGRTPARSMDWLKPDETLRYRLVSKPGEAPLPPRLAAALKAARR